MATRSLLCAFGFFWSDTATALSCSWLHMFTALEKLLQAGSILVWLCRVLSTSPGPGCARRAGKEWCSEWSRYIVCRAEGDGKMALKDCSWMPSGWEMQSFRLCQALGFHVLTDFMPFVFILVLRRKQACGCQDSLTDWNVSLPFYYMQCAIQGGKHCSMFWRAGQSYCFISSRDESGQPCHARVTSQGAAQPCWDWGQRLRLSAIGVGLEEIEGAVSRGRPWAEAAVGLGEVRVLVWVDCPSGFVFGC